MGGPPGWQAVFCQFVKLYVPTVEDVNSSPLHTLLTCRQSGSRIRCYGAESAAASLFGRPACPLRRVQLLM